MALEPRGLRIAAGSISGIPEIAYLYMVNGRSAVEWVMDQYQYSEDKDTKIVNSPQDFSHDPLYIIKLLKRVIGISVATVGLLDEMPGLDLI